ncbi:MAG TPA: ABC transporter permease [Tepidisphaeraceae bacterium]|nr:ABC transporter permease [Tepidisphaeraceae bacterium]
MKKTLVIVVREYLSAVKTKSFIISVVLMPVLMFGGLLMQRMTRGIVDLKDRKFAVIDQTGGRMFAAIEKANRDRNLTITKDAVGNPKEARFVFELVPANQAAGPESIKELRYHLSQKVEKGELFGFAEIGELIYEPPPVASLASAATQVSVREAQANPEAALKAVADRLGDERIIRYTTNRLTVMGPSQFLQRAATMEVYKSRLTSAGATLDDVTMARLLTPPMVSTKGAVFKDATGKLSEQSSGGQFIAFFRPLAMLMLMFVVVMVGVSPLTTNVIEEKSLRIAEVLLGSVSPFQLMMGKLVGGVGVALTLALIYLSTAWVGLRFGAVGIDVSQYLTLGLFAWFCLFTLFAALLYGAVFIAAGAAVTNVKEAQSLITPVMLLIVLPMFFISQLLENPNGLIPTFLSFFPFSAPTMMVARMGVPPGPAAWQPVVAAASTFVATLAVVWAAGRIFRVGILLQGQPAKLGQITKWIFSGS